MKTREFEHRGYIWMKHISTWLICSVLLINCSIPEQGNDQQKTKTASTLLSYLEPERTGIDFSNDLTETSTINRLNYEYLYNGGGVAIGDINNDGLPDLYFTGNMTSDRLYLNKGDLKFEDISEKAGITAYPGWSTGVSMIDINADGMLDIYVCRSGPYAGPASKQNVCFINRGDGTFTEQASAFGIAHQGFSVQSAFFDYDLDGDLDMYLLNHPAPGFKAASIQQHSNDIFSGKLQLDVFFENQDGQFIDRTHEAGFKNFGYRHGIAITDLDNNGYPDLFISSDFDEPDHLYMNNGNGGFTEQIKDFFRHTSYFSMGSDAADIDNDGMIDVFTVDMTPNDHKRSKENMASMNPAKFFAMTASGYHHQYMVNTLQWNRGENQFSEIAQLAGIAKTDWSWAPLFMDMDNDGFKDLFITNGIKRDVLNNDSRAAFADLIAQADGSLFVDELLATFPSSVIPNAVYRNKGGVQFEDASSWINGPSFNSNGAAFGDLDLDGDLDLVINSVDQTAAIYQNNSVNDHITIKLIGSESNPLAIGSKVEVKTGDQTQTQELYTSRGYLSSTDHKLVFGLGKSSVKSVQVIWPDRSTTVLNNPESNELLVIDYAKATKIQHPVEDESKKWISRISSSELGLKFKHEENDFDDFEDEVLLPHRQSMHGPMASSADVDGDGDEDLYIGGAKGQPARLYLQTPEGFVLSTHNATWMRDAEMEDLASLFFDADGDNDMDLYVVSGGIANKDNPKLFRDRLYINDGSGLFKRRKQALPDIQNSGGSVSAADIDLDGDLDLFVSGRINPGLYPTPTSSHILINEGGKFQDASGTLAPELNDIGLISDGIFTDVDDDGDPDLIIAGEWTAITVLLNEDGVFEIVDMNGLEKTRGLWFSLAAHDVDGDGDEDLLAGNLGLNAKFSVKGDKEFHVYASDFDQNGQLDIVLSNKYEGKLVPVRGRECSSEQMPFIAEKFESYSAFASADLQEIHGDNLADALHYEADILHSVWFEKTTQGYQIHELPMEAQLAPINDFLAVDLSGDGNDELIAIGNLYGAEVETVRYDASLGCVLQWKNDTWQSIAPKQSGLYTSGDSKDILMLSVTSSISGIKSGNVLMVTNNNDEPDFFQINE